MTSAISIGKQDFASLRENHYFYVDKTDFIRQWWESGDDITLITRPRRFGKSMAANMLAAYYDRSENIEELFRNLAISKDSSYKENLNQYDVI